MNIDDVNELWSKDCKIDDTQLDVESSNIPLLHSKYLNLMFKERTKLIKMQHKKTALNHLLYEYYSGDLNNKESLKLIKREPWQKKILKTELRYYVNADVDIIKINLMIDQQNEICEMLKSILSEINSRSFHISNMIKWKGLTQFASE